MAIVALPSSAAPAVFDPRVRNVLPEAHLLRPVFRIQGGASTGSRPVLGPLTSFMKCLHCLVPDWRRCLVTVSRARWETSSTEGITTCRSKSGCTGWPSKPAEQTGRCIA